MIQQYARKRDEANEIAQAALFASFIESGDNVLEGGSMHNEFTAVFEQDGDWFIAYCPEIPGANGQGLNREECRQNLAEAIALILEDRREDMMRGLPANADKETVIVAA